MNRSVALGTTVLLSLSAITGCARQDAPLPRDVTTALEAAFNKGDIAACVALYADDAEIIAEDAPTVRGRDAIAQFFKDQVSREISFDTDTVVSMVSGDVAIEQGTYRIRNVDRGVDVEHGDYLNVWRLSQGKWKAYRSMFNVTMSPNTVVSVAASPDDDEVTM
jgi:ketosteroid isomerase-like protein